MSQATWSKLIKPILPTENYIVIVMCYGIFYLINEIPFALTDIIHPKMMLSCINSLDESKVLKNIQVHNHKTFPYNSLENESKNSI